jgi:uncharacterized membrane protein YfcA
MSTVAGGMNSIAGGGTLLTFPALIGLGIPPLVANGVLYIMTESHLYAIQKKN